MNKVELHNKLVDKYNFAIKRQGRLPSRCDARTMATLMQNEIQNIMDDIGTLIDESKKDHK